MGEWIGLLIYWPRETGNAVDRVVAVDTKASDGMRHQVERLRVMKEACGTAAVVFLLMLVFVTLRFGFVVCGSNRPVWDTAGAMFPEWIVVAMMFVLSQRMHREHVNRQDRMMSAVLDFWPPPEASGRRKEPARTG